MVVFRAGRRFSRSALAPAALLLACGIAVAALPVTDALTRKRIDAALSSDVRSEENRARDRYRHPQETLSFFGLEESMSVIEIWPSAGWYAEILAPVLKNHGKYVAAVPARRAQDAEESEGLKKLKQKFADHGTQLGELHTVAFGPKDLVLAPPNSVDMVLTFRNLHNWMADGWADKAIGAMFSALKPGGIVGIEEHRGNPKVAQDPKADSGYVNEAYAIKLFEANGFKLAGRSEINANAKDTKDYKEGVWTLPPVLTLKDQDREKYLGIGESDRFTLRFQKPR